MRRSLPLVAALSLLTPTAHAAPVARAADDPESLVAEAIAADADIVAQRSRLEAISADGKAAGAWRDPRVAVEYSNMPIDRWAPGAHPMSGIQLRIEQTFLFPGKTRARREFHGARAGVVRAAIAERRVQLRKKVLRAYFKLSLVRQLRDVTSSHIKLLAQLRAVVKARYIVGKVGQHDLLRLQLLDQTLRDDLGRFDRDALKLVSEINAARRKPLSTPIATPAELAPPPAPREVKALLARARAARPLLRQVRAEATVRRRAARRAKREGYPDITAWLGYRLRFASTDNGIDFVGLGASVPIPIFSGGRASKQSAAALTRAKAAEQRVRAALDRINGALAGEVAAWRRARQKHRSYKGKLMPLAHRALDSTLAAYQVDRADFASLYQSELTLLSFERQIRRAAVAGHLARVNVEALVGARLDASSGAGAGGSK